MKKAILTSHYSFATSVCKDAALYFDPYDVNDIFKKIVKITKNKQLYNKMVAKGALIVEELPTSKDRANQYLKLCKREIKDVQK